MRLNRSLAALACGSFLLSTAHAAPAAHPQAETETLELAQKAIALHSVEGPGNQTADVAALFKNALIAGGFSADDITITPSGETAWMMMRWHGSDPSLKPLVISGHMDVVEAKPSDWTRDPFKPVVENGYLYGRGSTDMKLDDALAIVALIQLKREGYKPVRDIILEFSGDEETSMKTGEEIAKKLADAGMVLNVDGADGVLDEKSGKPIYFSWEGGEKTYADFRMTVTNPGGHSSEPRKVNAIYEMAAALLKIGKYQFKPELNDLTKSYFINAAQWQTPAIGAAMKAFAANPADRKAIETLSSEPSLIGQIGTTCVATMINGGHALNALPQKVTANINCRIFPGHKRQDIMSELQKIADDKNVIFEDTTLGSIATAASPLTPEVSNTIKAAVQSVIPGLSVFPGISAGASDSMWFRSHGIPSYGVSPLFIRPSENFMHGLNERTPVSSIRPSIDIMMKLVSDFAGPVCAFCKTK